MPNFEEVVDNIYLLKIPYGPGWTGVVLVRGEKNFLIDSGWEDPTEVLLPALRELGIEPEQIDYLLDTHCHLDHIGGHRSLVDQYHLKTVVLDKNKECLEHPQVVLDRMVNTFPQDAPQMHFTLNGVQADILLEENEVLEGRLCPIYTPGHEVDCTSWYDIPTRTLICGDSLQGQGMSGQGLAFYSDLPAYRNTLMKLSAGDIRNMIIAHEYDGLGAVLLGREAVGNGLQCCRDTIKLYDKKIRSYLTEGMTDVGDLADRLLKDCGMDRPPYRYASMFTVREHLKQYQQI